MDKRRRPNHRTVGQVGDLLGQEYIDLNQKKAQCIEVLQSVQTVIRGVESRSGIAELTRHAEAVRSLITDLSKIELTVGAVSEDLTDLANKFALFGDDLIGDLQERDLLDPNRKERSDAQRQDFHRRHVNRPAAPLLRIVK